MTTHGVGSAGIGDLGTGKGSMSGGGDGFVHATLLMAAAHSALDGSGTTPDFGGAAAAAAATAVAASEGAGAGAGAGASQGRSQGGSEGWSQGVAQGASQGALQGALSQGGASPGCGRSSDELSRGLGAAFCEACCIYLL
jgi:hypothetical protein